MRRLKVPTRYRFVFWDVNTRTLDVEKHSAFIISRVLEYGDMAAVRWLLTLYGKNEIAGLLRSRYARRLSPRTIGFWKTILRSGEKWCRKTSSAVLRDPFWHC